MSKIIKLDKPIGKWSGSVTIADPLTYPQADAIQLAFIKPKEDSEGNVWLSVIEQQRLPAIFACVEKWDLQNFPKSVSLDNFPASPRRDSNKLVEWIFSEILKVYLGELEIPNE